MQKIAGILLSIGALVSMTGEFRPVIFNIFGAIDNPQLQVEYFENDPTHADVWKCHPRQKGV